MEVVLDFHQRSSHFCLGVHGGRNRDHLTLRDVGVATRCFVVSLFVGGRLLLWRIHFCEDAARIHVTLPHLCDPC